MSQKLYSYTTVLSVLTCGSCSIPFAIPENFHEKAKADGESFWCPNGHKISYSQTENAKLKAELATARREREWADVSRRAAHDQALAAERSAAAYKGQATKLRKRIGNGVCPCCNRHFTNVERHMSTKHPDYRDSEATPGS